MLSQQTEAESALPLLRRIAAQDRQALGELYDQFAGVLYSVAWRILGDPHEAEEVIQDVFVQIWDKAAAFNAALGAPLTWALSITRNRSIDRVRARQRRSRVLVEMTEGGSAGPEAEVQWSEPSLLDGDQTRMVRTAVGNLPAEQRQAIEMAFFGGLTHLEIASALNEPLGTIKARIRRGMLKLRDSLQGQL